MKNITKSKLSFVLFCALFLLFFNSGFSQSTLASNLLLSENRTEYDDFLEFTAKKYDTVVYLSWVVKTDEKDYTFIIQRSYDKIEFETLGFKNAFGSKEKINILYCFSDEPSILTTDKIYYRICKIANTDNETVYSKIVKPVSIVKPVIEESSVIAVK
ncbi:MAG: hypothetical protein ABIJ97_12175 [Bacteroidota bacterium]